MKREREKKERERERCMAWESGKRSFPSFPHSPSSFMSVLYIKFFSLSFSSLHYYLSHFPRSFQVPAASPSNTQTNNCILSFQNTWSISWKQEWHSSFLSLILFLRQLLYNQFLGVSNSRLIFLSFPLLPSLSLSLSLLPSLKHRTKKEEKWLSKRRQKRCGCWSSGLSMNSPWRRKGRNRASWSRVVYFDTTSFVSSSMPLWHDTTVTTAGVTWCNGKKEVWQMNG